VFGVAAGALLARAGRDIVGGVQSLAGGKSGRDFRVTLEALQGGLASELVATGAVG
jgi:hypothetical protein